MGPIQVECKIFGTMNDEQNRNSPVGWFLPDNISKENANGKVIIGLLHNYASLHNEALTIIKSRKNQVSKYRKMNLFLD